MNTKHVRMKARERDARRRAREKQAGKPRRGGKGGKHHALFDDGHFVAVDGEGFNTGDEFTRVIGADRKVYTARQHEYALLSASDGSELYNPHGRLTTKQCLDFLLDIRINDPKAILVCFGASYDMTHMLAFGLEREEIDQLLHGDGTLLGRKTLDVTLDDGDGAHDYRLELRNRKSLSIWRWPAGAEKYEQKERRDGMKYWRMTKCDRVVLWDVWGFFQGSFVGALETWLPLDPDTPLIAAMKKRRSEFARREIALVREYNNKELRCLVDMMNKVREAVQALGLKISRWDGAGAIAGAMMALHGVKDHMAASPRPVFDAACCAYSGGHIEACRIGYYRGAVYHYDINSAYPHQFRHLPSLANGEWKSGSADQSVPDGFTLVRLEFRFRPGLPFYPLFYRQPNNCIIYPERGAGWYWHPEYEAARVFAEKFGAIEFRVLQWWHFETRSNYRPFSFIEEYYDLRKKLVEESKRTGIPNGQEKTLKLGYNSCYGKTCQQVGARIDHGEILPPTFFQIEWGGYVTAGCRAQLMQAAMQKPDAIISFATDGLFSTEPLDLYCPAEKQLGAWEFQQHAAMCIVMPGIYWLYDEPSPKRKKSVTGYSRGFDKDAMETADFVIEAWKEGKSHVFAPSHRMVTLGTALMSDEFWDMRGLFVSTERFLSISGGGKPGANKRYPASMSTARPHREFVLTHPQDLMEDYDAPLTGLASAPYPVAWSQGSGAGGQEPSEPDAFVEQIDAAFFVDREAMLLA